MAPPITIEALKLEGFRAYLQPQTVNLYRGKKPLSLAVFAPNAKGKSSLVDAFEYYFSEEATLARLGKRSAQTHAGPLAMEHVDAKENGVTPSVHFWFRQDNDNFDEARPVSTAAPPLPEAGKRLLSCTKLPFIIRGHELRGFVEETTPENRYKEMASWFALDPLLTIQQNLRLLRRQIKQKAESKTEANERLRDLKRTTKATISAWDEAKVCVWLNTNVLAHLDNTLTLAELTDKDAGYQELVKRKAAEGERIGLAALNRLVMQIEALFKAPEDEGEDPSGTIVAFEKAVSLHAAAVAHAAAERAKSSQAVFNDVWASAKTLFENKDADFDACPVCDTDFASSPHGSREKVHVSLDTKLGDLGEYRNAESELQEATRALDEAVRALKADLEASTSNLKDAGFEEKAKRVVAYLEKVKAWKVGDKARDSTEAVQELNALPASITTERDRIEKQQGEHTYANALKVADDLIQIRSDLERIRRTKAELQALHEELNKQALAINKAIVEHTENLIGKLQDDVDDLYKDIQGDDANAPPIRFELPQEDDTNQQRVQLLIDFAENRKGVVPSGYLSDSQIHTLALALRLSAIRLFNVRVPIIVLDDVVTSYDADHRKNIAAVLAKHFADCQIILVTHDEQFFNLLQDHLSPARWVFRRIARIEPKFGPCFHDHRTPDESIQARLDANESAAAEMRQAEEEWLLDICRGFGVKVVIRPVDRPYQFERSELADALASFLKRVGILPPEVPGISNTFLSSLQKGVVENFASHFSDNPYKNASVGDEKARWKEFQYFRDQLQSGDPKSVEAAILSITALGNAKSATDLASLFPTEGAISALSKITESSNRSVAEGAKRALEFLFNSLISATALIGSIDGGKGRWGCGFFVDSRGYLLTLGFVIAEQEKEISVNYSGVIYKASLVSPSSENDLVLLRIENGTFPVLCIDKNEKLHLGEEIYVVGPERNTKAWNFSRGNVEGILKRTDDTSYIKTRIDVELGYAGAPAINQRNNVVGIVAMKEGGNSIAYLLGTDRMSAFLDQYLPREEGVG